MSSFTEAKFVEVPGKFRKAWRWWVFSFEGRQVYAAVDGFVFYIGNPVTGAFIGVPDGFETDGASIPTWMLFLMPKAIRRLVMGQLAKAAALHDWMRECLDYNLIDCDALFLVAMRADKVWKPLREVAFILVRLNKSREP